MPPEGFEPAIPASKRPQTYALDRAATGIGTDGQKGCKNSMINIIVRPTLRVKEFHASTRTSSNTFKVPGRRLILLTLSAGY